MIKAGLFFLLFCLDFDRENKAASDLNILKIELKWVTLKCMP